MQVVQKLRKCQWQGKQGWWIQFTTLSDQGFQQAPTTNKSYFAHRSRLLFSRTGADPGSFLGGGALVSCSTSTPINQIVFFCRIPVVLENRRSSQGGVRTPCTLPLDPPLWKKEGTSLNNFVNKKYNYRKI